MDFNSHSALADKHALLSPSSYHWMNYDDQKLEAKFASSRAAAKGTQLHILAHSAITLGVKLSKADSTLSSYVNDGIGYKMTVEQPLYFSDNCFGHADTISFRRGVLRIHDLKTGVNKSSVHQLEVYAAIFCLEYGHNPHDIKMEFRIYQNGGPTIYDGDPVEVSRIMDTIVYFDQKIEKLKEDS